jgi:L-alanine-DL-glutamate epimerase-like enolase superfamily enzyme
MPWTGPDIPLMVDTNCAWTPAEMIDDDEYRTLLEAARKELVAFEAATARLSSARRHTL